MKSPKAVAAKSINQPIYLYLFLSTFLILFLLLPATLWASTFSATTGQSTQNVTGASSKTLVNVPYVFTVTVSSPWHYINGTSFDYGTYYAACPAMSTTLNGPSASDIASVAACTCDSTKCHPPYLAHQSANVAQTMAWCLAFIPTYVATNSLPAKGANGVMGNMPVQTNDPTSGKPYNYPYNDNPSGLGIINGPYYNPIANFNPQTSYTNFNYIKATGRSRVAGSLPCPN